MSGVSTGRRVVVTGLGLVTCLGVGVEHVWSKLLRGESGITRVKGPGFDKVKLTCNIAGQVPKGSTPGDLNMGHLYSSTEQRKQSLAALYALEAAREALTMARWGGSELEEEERMETGVSLGTGVMGTSDIYKTGETLYRQGYKKVDPHFIPRILANIPAGLISMKYGFQGPIHAVSSACTTGLHATGDAFRFIKYGDANVMVCGGTEACIDPIILAGLGRMKFLSTSYNDEPHKASRPFDKAREGLVLSEGSGVLVLEELEHAKARGVEIIAEVKGYGLSGDAYHISHSEKNGRGAELSMLRALKEANVGPCDIGYINAHAVSTPLGDAAELRAISRVFQNTGVAVSSTKSSTGHLIGASGSVESIFTIMTLKAAMMPFNITLEDMDDEFEHMNLLQGKAMHFPTNSKHVLTNSFGFGGANGSLCFGSYNE
ncbi:unnamed protein product [Owenia fusiformis]|uniref:3-oxoacyl-[acyl-carrier-protein] synthase n=1 Tax=Owenia fusiformis TaxID=6347 RepID=A0A8J1UC93_OWEFU|nr:unnamed protein product [Owenia fusiformis]